MCDGGHFAPPTPAVPTSQDMDEEVAMTAAVKRAGTGFVRWLEEFRRQNRPPHKWYERDLYGC
jgi:hypothetical protein